MDVFVIDAVEKAPSLGIAKEVTLDMLRDNTFAYVFIAEEEVSVFC